ncbi:MAG: AraC family transcriptional regulator [Gemmatimonadales bacterium]
MPSTTVPLHHGSPRFAEMEVGPFRITDVQFDPGSRLEPHSHDRPNLGIMLGGSFDLGFGARQYQCRPGVLFVEPAGETHCNCMGCQGARVIAVQPDVAALGHDRSLDRLLVAPSARFDPQVNHLGRRLAREFQGDDPFSRLMIEGLALELLAVAGRTSPETGRAPPRWLLILEERLRDGGVERLRIADLAREAGVHPTHLAREFRARHRRSLGGFLLERRLEWAAHQLRATRRPVAEIALEAGFADQSHFTRRFREYSCSTPARYRKPVH